MGLDGLSSCRGSLLIVLGAVIGERSIIGFEAGSPLTLMTTRTDALYSAKTDYATRSSILPPHSLLGGEVVKDYAGGSKERGDGVVDLSANSVVTTNTPISVA